MRLSIHGNSMLQQWSTIHCDQLGFSDIEGRLNIDVWEYKSKIVKIKCNETQNNNPQNNLNVTVVIALRPAFAEIAASKTKLWVNNINDAIIVV